MIHGNFIFTNIHEFDHLEIHHSRKLFRYTKSTYESIMHCKFKFMWINLQSQYHEITREKKVIYSMSYVTNPTNYFM